MEYILKEVLLIRNYNEMEYIFKGGGITNSKFIMIWNIFSKKVLLIQNLL